MYGLRGVSGDSSFDMLTSMLTLKWMHETTASADGVETTLTFSCPFKAMTAIVGPPT